MNYDTLCYIRRAGETLAKNTASLFPGMYLVESKNVMSYGAVKNVVTESFPEADGLSVLTPSVPARDAVEVKLRFVFLDEGCQLERNKTYRAFNEYIEGRVFEWWDTTRKQKMLLVDGKAKVETDESFKGSIPYFYATFTFRNNYGKPVDADYWVYAWTQGVCAKLSGARYSGWLRHKTLTFTRDNGTTRAFSILDQFDSGSAMYIAISDSEFALLDDESYMSRLSAFQSYTLGVMKGYYSDFNGNVDSVMEGASVYDTVSCPLS